MKKLNIVNESKLSCVYDKRNSFYGKAKVLIDDEGNKYLKSYNSIIAEIHKDKVKINSNIPNCFSQTSLRHIKEFLKQNGFKVGTKKELINMYC